MLQPVIEEAVVYTLRTLLCILVVPAKEKPPKMQFQDVSPSLTLLIAPYAETSYHGGSHAGRQPTS